MVCTIISDDNIRNMILVKIINGRCTWIRIAFSRMSSRYDGKASISISFADNEIVISVIVNCGRERTFIEYVIYLRNPPLLPEKVTANYIQ